MKFFILCGAHKTASTHFVDSLLANEELLKKRPAAVIGPDVMRAEFGPLLEKIKQGIETETLKEEAAEIIARHAPEAEIVLLCDETLLGGTDAKMLFDGGMLYPWGPHRVARLRALLPEGKVRVALGTRAQATFLPSCYGESLYHTPYQDFASYLGGIDPAALSWANLVERLRETVEVPVVLWRYEDYPYVGVPVVKELVGRGISTKFEMGGGPSRVGFSQHAIDEVAKASTGKKPADLDVLRKEFPKSVLYPGPKPFMPDAIERLDALYADDYAAIAEFRRVTIVTPEE